jgi:16S rRNA (guanine966-N2)-methyltransferase
MRIIAGKYGGRTITAPPGATTRPTTSRIRESWASTLASALPAGFEDIHVLDAFAGSGALGIEALSRGANGAVFCEKDARSYQQLKDNLRQLGVGEEALVLKGDVLAPQLQLVLIKQAPFDLVILDPPYKTPQQKLQTLLRSLARAGRLAPGALVAFEHGSDADNTLTSLPLCAACSPATLMLLATKTYGETTIDFMRAP